MADGDVLRMKHTIQRADGVIYFYEGELPVKEGVIEIPKDTKEFDSWVRRAYINGYQLDPENDDEPFEDVENALASGNKKSTKRKSAKSEKETDEGSDSGRQPGDKDGVREG
jgi:hypothetical protein